MTQIGEKKQEDDEKNRDHESDFCLDQNLSKKTNKCESDENDSNNSQISKYDDSIMSGTKSTETKQVTPNSLVTTKQHPIQEPKETDIQITSNLICSITILGRSLISRYPNSLYDQFAAELNLQLKTSRSRHQNKPKFNIWSDIIPNT